MSPYKYRQNVWRQVKRNKMAALQWTDAYNKPVTIDVTNCTITSNTSYDTTWFGANNTAMSPTSTGQVAYTVGLQPYQVQQIAAYVNPPPVIERPRGFNRYVNASDLLEEFIGWLGTQDVRQGAVMGLPVEAFVKWLVIRACEEDNEDPGLTLELPSRPPQPRCLGCQKFMPTATVVPLHGDRCASRYFGRTAIAA